MRAPKVVDFYTAAWPDFTPALTVGREMCETSSALQPEIFMKTCSCRPNAIRVDMTLLGGIKLIKD
jgi:hypothetical protein